MHFLIASYDPTTYVPTFHYFTKLPGHNLSERTVERPHGVIDTYTQTLVSDNGKRV